jgi:aryl-phospho-beta-D-glucosidase BglC (GH1 family)
MPWLDFLLSRWFRKTAELLVGSITLVALAETRDHHAQNPSISTASAVITTSRKLAHVSLGALALIFSPAPAQAGASLLPSGYLSAKGNQIVDQNGNPVRIACVGYFSPGNNIPADMAGIVAAGFNCLRYPWYDATMNGTGVNSLALADQIVAAASAAGLKVILDHHGNETPGPNNGWLPYPGNGLWYDLGGAAVNGDGNGDNPGHYTSAQVTADWVTVAQRYAGNPTVIGFDLTNEPHLSPSYWATNPGGSTWGTSAAGNGSATPGSDTDIRYWYSQTAVAIQAVNPGALIIAEGVGNQTGTLFNGTSPAIVGEADLTLAQSQPVTTTYPGKLVYSIHNYPTPIGGVSPDSGATAIASMNQSWGYLLTQDIAPIFIGEMGGSLDGTDDSSGSNLADEQAWASTLIAYANGKAAGGPTFSGNQQGISTDWWAWGNLAGEDPDGSLLPSGALNPAQYAVYSQLQFFPESVAPAITRQPAGATIAVGQSFSLSVAASGTTPSYQWYVNGAAIAGATGATLLMSNASASDAGNYTCVATNPLGSATSSAATVAVVSTNDIGRLVDISCRADSEAGSSQLIAGFVIGGANTAGTQTVLVRATGPSLATFGLTGVLPDPELTLNQSLNAGNVLVATNKGWANNPTVASTAESVGAFSWPSNSVDAALVETLGEGPYTAQVTGVSGDSGIALAEMYDATPGGTYTATTPRLINISARVEVGTGASVLIAGFVIGGATSETVLIRASGPALDPFDLTGTLPDPMLSLYQSNSDGSNTLLQSNTGWGGSPQIALTAANVGAFSWGTTATPDSAVLVTLPPGAYTAEVAGSSGDSGIALVEVYEVR